MLLYKYNIFHITEKNNQVFVITNMLLFLIFGWLFIRPDPEENETDPDPKHCLKVSHFFLFF